MIFGSPHGRFFVPDKLDVLDSIQPQDFSFVQHGFALPDMLDGL
jgi:hypothetical protein